MFFPEKTCSKTSFLFWNLLFTVTLQSSAHLQRIQISSRPPLKLSKISNAKPKKIRHVSVFARWASVCMCMSLRKMWTLRNIRGVWRPLLQEDMWPNDTPPVARRASVEKSSVREREKERRASACVCVCVVSPRLDSPPSRLQTLSCSRLDLMNGRGARLSLSSLFCAPRENRTRIPVAGSESPRAVSCLSAEEGAGNERNEGVCGKRGSRFAEGGSSREEG